MSERSENNARLFVIAAPSGAGKTTLVKALVERNPELRFSISYTTREPRASEEHGRDYFFVSIEEFTRLKEQGQLLESALVFDNHYGTGRQQVESHLQNGDNVLLEIDWQGAQQVRASLPDAVSVFVMPPSRSELERRLRHRKTDSEAIIARRLRDALGDMSHWDEFSYVIVNDDIGQATREFEAILAGHAEQNRVGSATAERAVRDVFSA